MFSACANLSKAKLSKIHAVREGQSPDELTEVLGSPAHRSSISNKVVWYYDIYAEDSSKTYPYTAEFQNNKLTKFIADQSRNAKDRLLCVQRKKSDQTVFEFAGKNGAPEIRQESCGD